MKARPTFNNSIPWLIFFYGIKNLYPTKDETKFVAAPCTNKKQNESNEISLADLVVRNEQAEVDILKKSFQWAIDSEPCVHYSDFFFFMSEKKTLGS